MCEDKINVIVRVEVLELFLKIIQSYYRNNVIYIGEQFIESPENFKKNLHEDVTHVQFSFNLCPIEFNETLLWGLLYIPEEYKYFTTELYPILEYQYLTENEFLDSLSKYSKPTTQDYYNRLNGNFLTNLDEILTKL